MLPQTEELSVLPYQNSPSGWTWVRVCPSVCRHRNHLLSVDLVKEQVAFYEMSRSFINESDIDKQDAPLYKASLSEMSD
jgi:hypothetical protein